MLTTLRRFNVYRARAYCALDYSTNVSVQEKTPTKVADFSEYDRISKIHIKGVKRKPQRPPFVKNLFLGIFDNEMLTYPESMEKSNVEQLFKDVAPVGQFFSEPDNVKLASKGLSASYIEALNSMQLIGLKTNQVSGGRELNTTETCVFNESIMRCSANNNIMSHEILGVQTLLKCASLAQQNKYLGDASTGKLITAFCVTEQTNLTADVCKSTCVYDASKHAWVLNGKKSLVLNGKNAGLFLVLAETESPNENGLKEIGNTAFLVEKAFGGIKITSEETMGLNGIDVANLEFENTSIPKENIIGSVNQGDKVLSAILAEYRLSTGPALIALNKELTNSFTNWCKAQSEGSTDYTTADSVHTIISNMTMSTYAMESMTYLTSAMMDVYDNQDCELETAIVKTFSAEHCHQNAVHCMEIIGSPAYLTNHWCNKLYKDASSYLVLNESIKSVKLIIALLGLQHAGVSLQSMIKMVRNPLYFPVMALKRLVTQRRQEEDNPKLTLGLKYHLHPSLTLSASLLEYSVLRLQFATEIILSRYGNELVTKHNDLERLADAIIDIYAMVASLGRASRSYCIGLENAEHEILIANSICILGRNRVQRAINEICEGPYINSDENNRKISERVLEKGNYFPVHPLTRNF